MSLNENIRKIYQTFPDLKIKWERSLDTITMHVLNPDGYWTLSINPEESWQHLERRIKLKITGKNDPFCQVCYEHSNNFLSCSKCGNKTCASCYTDIVITHQGKYVCPFCRFEFGDEIDDFDAAGYVESTFHFFRSLENIFH